MTESEIGLAARFFPACGGERRCNMLFSKSKFLSGIVGTEKSVPIELARLVK
jgi:hypothetical protein